MSKNVLSLLLAVLTLPVAAGDSVVRKPPVSERPVASNALPPFTAISAKGFIHSTERGFKFPDGTVQTTAATAGGGVPSVNGITGPVTIEGDDATTVTSAARRS